MNLFFKKKKVKKEKWKVYVRVLKFINTFEPKYNPLFDKKY